MQEGVRHGAGGLAAYLRGDPLLRRFFEPFAVSTDDTSTGSVQVMLFTDRLEVWNPGTLPPPLTLEMLRQPHGSVPGNPLLAEPLYLTKYIERMGTGTGDMINRCRKAGLPEPEFTLTDGFVTTIRRNPELAFEAVAGKKRPRTGQVTGQVTGEVGRQPESQPESTGEVTGEVERVVRVLRGEMKRTAIQKALRLRHEDYFREAYLIPALVGGFIEMTIPDKPASSRQKYRLTAKGQTLRDRLRKGKRSR